MAIKKFQKIELANSDHIPFLHFKAQGFENLGDYLGKYLTEKISEKETIEFKINQHPHLFLTIGSIISPKLPNQTVYWGSGIISKSIKPNIQSFYTAVRGPLTKKILYHHGLKNNTPIGDPALLLPAFIKKPNIQKKYKIGIIPHYIDQDDVKNRLDQNLSNSGDVLLIDIKTTDVQHFLNEIASCELVLSSSLHGIIISHAYGIPALWVEFSSKVIGNGFKFNDYFLSVGIEPYRPIDKTEGIIEFDSMMNKHLVSNPYAQINNFNPSNLIEACPFAADSMKDQMIKTLGDHQRDHWFN